MRTTNIKPTSIFFLSALFLFFSQILNAQTLSLQLTASNFNGFNISCFGNQNGTIDLTVSGGTAPYTYQWSNDATTEDLSALASGYYHVTVTDSNQVSAEAEITLTEPKQIKIDLAVYKYPNGFNVSQNGSCNGNVAATVFGGVSPYTYHWNPGNQTVSNPTNLCAGIVFAEVTDNNGCLLKENTVLSQPEKDTWLSSGNTGSNPENQFIGTTDEQDFIIKTNGDERMRVGSDGKITMPTNGNSHFERLVAGRIVSPDSLIYFGDSTLIINTSQNRIYGDPNGVQFKGTGIGIGTVAFGHYSLALGRNCLIGISGGTNGSNADNTILIGNGLTATAAAIGSIVIGAGITGGARMSYADPHSIAMGINSSIPTLVITQASGTGTTGSVYIGLPDPANPPAGLTNFKLAVNGNILATEVKV